MCDKSSRTKVNRRTTRGWDPTISRYMWACQRRSLLGTRERRCHTKSAKAGVGKSLFVKAIRKSYTHWMNHSVKKTMEESRVMGMKKIP